MLPMSKDLSQNRMWIVKAKKDKWTFVGTVSSWRTGANSIQEVEIWLQKQSFKYDIDKSKPLEIIELREITKGV